MGADLRPPHDPRSAVGRRAIARRRQSEGQRAARVGLAQGRASCAGDPPGKPGGALAVIPERARTGLAGSRAKTGGGAVTADEPPRRGRPWRPSMRLVPFPIPLRGENILLYSFGL